MEAKDTVRLDGRVAMVTGAGGESDGRSLAHLPQRVRRWW